MRLPSFGLGLAGLLLAAAASRAAPPRPLAVVVSKRLRSMDAALAGARRVARRHGTKLRVYRLDEGANQVDRAAAALTRGTLGGVVSLGAAARGFVDERTRGGVTHVATLVLPDPARPVDQAWVRFDASPEEWTQLAGLLSEPGAPVGALASDDLA